MSDNKKNLLDKMSLIDVDYVEAAVYPKAHWQTAKSGRAVKTAAAAAAVIAISAGCISFFPKVRVLAEEFFNSYTSFDEHKFEGNMEPIKINDGVTSEQIEAKYNNIEEVEQLLGIKLLHSSKTYAKPVPMVFISGSANGPALGINDNAYYMHNEIIDMSKSEDGSVSTRVGNNAYKIKYYACFLLEQNGHGSSGMSSLYENAAFVENYTTANKLKSAIFSFGGEHIAVIYNDNIRYEITLQCFEGSDKDVQILKDYLDTLS